MSDILVTRSSLPTFEEYIEEIRDLWESHWLTNMGVKHQELERALCTYLGVSNMVLFVNGHQALECILEALDLPKGGEIITTPYTFASTTHAIVRKGFTPVFCDIDPVTYVMDANKIEELITPRTCAILPVHVYGNICDVEGIQKIANKHGLKVIYDAAHAFGVTYKGKSIASYGDASMFSFHATKVFHTIEGGAVCFQDHSLKEKLNQWKNFGIVNAEEVEYAGGNAKMNEFCAAMGLCNLRHLPGEIEKRKGVIERYRYHLKHIPGIQLCDTQEGVVSNYAYFPIVVDERKFGFTRNDIFEALAKKGIGARKYFYPLTNNFNCYKTRFYSGNTPVANWVADRVLTLPLYADLSLEDVDRICRIIGSLIA